MANNVLNRYLFEDLSVRGELVQLDEAYQRIISSKEYPAALQKLLGELLVSTTLLTATLKFEGSITIQLQGDGPVSLAVINGDHDQKIRGVARWEGDIADDASLHDMMGKGYLVITIEPKKGERYQGVVGLEGETLADVIEGYFANSEQLKTRLWIRTGEHEGKAHAAGMMIQVMPDGTGTPEDFEHLEQLTATVKNEELFTLPANELLYRLYNQDSVRLYEPQPVEFHCGCSRERSGAAIITVERAEINDILAEEGSVSLHCDYCGTSYSFDEAEITELYAQAAQEKKTLH
ncbi:Redox regulated molecular chaperone. Protects both thermally unfolding and oxidatively damaged proteins from irreversible aggregation. Plays an important role in the bacterial defense system toward oxidative stress [Vibrio sp. B1FIG11]|uniref:Hsp33 family molecular chaperone HslO n=1 Tax=Vibrio sp. B1FIG11 TaxID=2751177 RepID=UPI001AF863AC|nr:Hsp33 family molecular chaperone HslO [Vibrio sp. B1FIG11]CAD7797295.1 Redox regulated molecular chaperone. Protects both thermally unfolding and oxidatively damaged proteins from irreversible aggregation. Plays an important role in the bacterial defense system toward oxidative stress [Vibrio sp. B1FIG11]CAE6879534.1 Redox regulated molecular chaperone. Protects both thermally unfolding and oxidatively damaged proteins from irreversible aggregation. Plays an important role in the bacterial def